MARATVESGSAKSCGLMKSSRGCARVTTQDAPDDREASRVTSKHLHLNTIVAALMELFNELGDFNADPANASSADVFAVREALEITGHNARAVCAARCRRDVGRNSGHSGRSCFQAGPVGRVPIRNLRAAEELEIPIQVNGKLVRSPRDRDRRHVFRVRTCATSRTRGRTRQEIVKVVIGPNVSKHSGAITDD